MGFFFDALRSLLAESVEAKVSARAAMAGRMLHTEGFRLGPAAQDGGRLFEVWHFPKGGKHPQCAVTLTLSPVEPEGTELLMCSLADAAPEPSPVWAAVLEHVRGQSTGPAMGDVLPPPEGMMGRSSYRHLLVAPPQSLRQTELADYEAVLEARLVELVTLTDREATWIGAHGGEAYLTHMADQGVAPFADRRAGDTRLGEVR